MCVIGVKNNGGHDILFHLCSYFLTLCLSFQVTDEVS